MHRPTSLIALALAVVATRSFADPRAECVAAYESGQRSRKAGDLVAARGELARCAQRDCPGLVRTDCVDWLRQVDDALPTIVIRIQDGGGADVADARIYVDDRLVRDRSDGRAIFVNPGEHRLRAERGDARATSTIVIAEGEKNRSIQLSFAARESVAPPPQQQQQTAPADEPERSQGAPVAAWVFAGVSAAALGSFAYFGITGRGEVEELRDECAPECEEAELDAAKRKLIIADISLAVAAISGGTAIWLFVDSASGPTNDAKFRAGVAPISGGASVRVRVAF